MVLDDPTGHFGRDPHFPPLDMAIAIDDSLR
jgi:hypothetical protein